MIKIKGGAITDHDRRLQKAFAASMGPKQQAAQSVVKETPSIRDTRAQPNDEEEQTRDEAFDPDLDVADADYALEQIRAKRLAEIKAAQQAKTTQANLGHGSYVEIKEDEFLPSVIKSPRAVVSFFSADFPRCLIVDKHLSLLARQHPEARFVRIDATKAPFFVQKLKIVVLPTILLFKDGVNTERVVGFDELGGRDDFKTLALEKRLVQGDVVKRPEDWEPEEAAAAPFNPLMEANLH
jgi:thiol-disulfide isomerase/thioredoxin